MGYTKLVLDHHGHFRDVSVETFQLIGTSPQVQRINAKLIRPLAGEKALWFECMRDAEAWSSYGGNWDESLEPKMITRRWLTVAHITDEFCSGAHPEEANIPRTFDLSTGQEIKLHDWLNGQAVKPIPTTDPSENITQLTPVFRTFVIGKWKPEESECAEAVRSQDYWHIELTRTALVFTPDLAHAVQACGDNFAVPFARLAPYLSAQGKAGIAAVQSQ